MQEILFSNDSIWHDATQTVFDPRRLAWTELDKQLELRPFLSGKSPLPTETVKVSYSGPQRVELDANLDSAGIVVLADVYYPGWKLAIDDHPAPIYKVNRVMRGAAVPQGEHKLVYTYEPRTFQVGGWITLAGLAAAVVLAVYCALYPAVRGPSAAASGAPAGRKDRSA